MQKIVSSGRDVIMDILDQKFNRLTVKKFFGVIKHRSIWECLCDCGVTVKVAGQDLRSGNTKSCGCYKKEKTASINFSHGQQSIWNKTAEHRAWRHIKSRCLNKNVHNYDKYGGRGIKICDRWINSFENFFEDMGKRPSNKHSMDRINVNGNYEPTNCRWATISEQSYNKRNTVRYEFNGGYLLLPELAEILKVKKNLLWSYINKKSLSKAIKYYKTKNSVCVN